MAKIKVGAVTIDDTRLRKAMDEFDNDQVPFAMATAVNDLAFDTMRIEKFEMQHVFDRPHPFVVKGLKIAKRATKKESRPNAAIWFSEAARDRFGGFIRGQVHKSEILENIVRPHIDGGGRNRKSTEKRLRGIGVIRESEWMIPAYNTKRDRYGNVSPGKYVEILSYFRSFSHAGVTANRRRGSSTLRSGVKFWIAPVSGNTRGIFETRNDGPPRLVFILTSNKPTYRKRFDFYGEAQRHANKFGPFFARAAMERALRSSRR